MERTICDRKSELRSESGLSDSRRAGKGKSNEEKGAQRHNMGGWIFLGLFKRVAHTKTGEAMIVAIGCDPLTPAFNSQGSKEGIWS